MIKFNFFSLFVLICLSTIKYVENYSILNVGFRIIGDQLLVKDKLSLNSARFGERSEISYAVPEPITHISIHSEENLYADVTFSYRNDLVRITFTTINSTQPKIEISTPIKKPFEIEIEIYGFNRTIMNVNSAYILNRDQHFNGIFQPYQPSEEIKNNTENDDEYDEITDEDYLEVNEKNLRNNSNIAEYTDGNDIGMDNENNDDVIDEDDVHDSDADLDFEEADKVIELGHRQNGDYLIYETYQTSSATIEMLPSLSLPTTSTIKPPATNQSVVFYYIDNDYITCVKFIVLDHYIDKTTSASDYNPPTVECSHFSPRTLKAIVTDEQTSLLVVQMSLYGYKPKDLPVDYIAFLPQAQYINNMATESPIRLQPKHDDDDDDDDENLSHMQRLKKLLNSPTLTYQREQIPTTMSSSLVTNIENVEQTKENHVTNNGVVNTMSIYLLISIFILTTAN